MRSMAKFVAIVCVLSLALSSVKAATPGPLTYVTGTINSLQNTGTHIMVEIQVGNSVLQCFTTNQAFWDFLVYVYINQVPVDVALDPVWYSTCYEIVEMREFIGF
jgi:hypothetical protein